MPGNHWRDNGASLVGKEITWKKAVNIISVIDAPAHHSQVFKYLSSAIKSYLVATRTHIRLGADRDLVPEENSSSPVLESNGMGGTNVIQLYINRSDYDRDLIQVRLLTALNEVFYPDIRFSEIIVKFHQPLRKWEIYLGSEGRQPFSLSKSGSGLKTVILVLLNLLIRPDFEKKDIEDYIFSFEEIENNLHPSLQRNLFLFLLNFSRQFKCHIFLTSHSPVAIDIYHGQQDVQIIHVKKSGTESFSTTLENYSHGYELLADLGAKASDLLQANGVIWVEGPSDRVFLNRFIELWGKGVYKEGQHYQFIYYGGSVLANIDASLPESIQEAISAFRINRNFIFVCDSDRPSKHGKLKNRVTTLLESIVKEHSYIWVTKCREIENYVPKEAFEAVYGVKINSQIGEFEYINDFLIKINVSRAQKYTEKHRKAVALVEHFTKNNLAFRPELDRVMLDIIERLRVWNN